MKGATENEMRISLIILKNPEKMYNANSIAKEAGISAMGALKILKKLEKSDILMGEKLGKAVFYKINKENEYARAYLSFLLKKEAQEAPPQVKRWLTELKKIKNVKAAILFGSVLRNEKAAHDIDVLIVIDEEEFSKVKKEIEKLNAISNKHIHALYQTEGDLKESIKKQDKVILSAIKGIEVIGNIIELIA